MSTVSSTAIGKYQDYLCTVGGYVGMKVTRSTTPGVPDKVFVPRLHAIFQYGTVVMLDDPNPPHTDAMPFSPDAYLNQWPIERLEDPKDITTHILNAGRNYGNACNAYGSGIAYAAFSALIKGGYMKADDTATRSVSTLVSGLHIITYGGDDDIVTITDSHSECDFDTALVLGSEVRRRDFMFPKLVACVVCEG